VSQPKGNQTENLTTYSFNPEDSSDGKGYQKSQPFPLALWGSCFG